MKLQNDIARQQRAIDAWARKHNVRIIKKYADQPSVQTQPHAMVYNRYRAKDRQGSDFLPVYVQFENLRAA